MTGPSSGGGNGLRLLIVTPVLHGTGEIVTALHLAEEVRRSGGTVGFVATKLARDLVSPRLDPPTWPLGEDASENRRSWERALAEFRPTVVLFADYPLMFFPSGSAPLAKHEGWVSSLAGIDAALVTLDHFGFAQGERALYLGPSHLGFFTQYHLPALPTGMHVLLPCPMHEPGVVERRIGTPFRYWDFPLTVSCARREEVRGQYLGDGGGKLVMHSVPRWAIQGARDLRLPLYDFLPEVLERYLGTHAIPVTLVSVNDGTLLRPPPRGALRIVNRATLPASDFEDLLLSADLVLTENALSIAMGKALCAGVPCGALVNSARAIDLIGSRDPWMSALVLAMERERTGAVYPWEVFPSVTPQDVEVIGLYRDNRITNAFMRLQLFGGESTRQQMGLLLSDETAIAALGSRQRTYRDEVAALPTGGKLLYDLALMQPDGA